MHDYSLDTDYRKYAYVGIACISLALPALMKSLWDYFHLSVYTGFPLSFGVIFSILFMLFDRCLWKVPAALLNFPNLNGTWEGEGVSSYKENGEPFRYKIKLTIKQSFSRISVFAETAGSISKSTLAGFNINSAKVFFRYSYENTPLSNADPSLQRHPGLIELRINDNTHMVGDYFAGKHRLSYGTISFSKVI